MTPPTGLRRAMAWIHGWLGLLAAWILFTMFLTGTASYFRPEITRWMQPERSNVVVSGPEAAAAAVGRLVANGKDDDRWTIFLPTPRDRETKLFARPRGIARKPLRQELDPQTGLPFHARATEGGELLYKFHYELRLPQPWGEWVAGLCAMAMLSAIISGVITHKRIFADFFTMRWGKGQRSWLDAHNLVAVLGLPYHLVITYTGLITLATIYMPWPIRANYPTIAAYSAEAYPADLTARRLGRPAPLAPVAPIVRDAEARLGGPASSVTIRYPGDAGAIVSVAGSSARGLAARGASLSYSGTTGRLLAASRPQGPGIATGAALFGLHLGYFAGVAMRWMFFLLGLAGTAMVGSGLILWSVKRKRDGDLAGHRLVEWLNIAAIACFPAGIAAYFLANRLIPAGLEGRAQGEVWALFGSWALLTLLAGARPSRRAWILTLAVAACLYLAVPVADLLLIGIPRDALFWSFDLTMLVTAMLFGGASRRMARPVMPRLRVRAGRDVVHVVA